MCFFNLPLFSDAIAKRVIYHTIAFILLYTIPTVIFSIFQCNPVHGYWTKTIDSKCLNTLPAFYINSISNILADIWLIAFVIPRIWQLKMAQKQKIALFAIVTLSWLVVVAAIVRVVWLAAVFNSISNTGGDQMGDFYDVSIRTGLAVSMGIFWVSAPASKHRWTLKQNGIIELADQDSEWSGTAKHTAGSTWAIDEFDVERGQGSGAKGGIVKSTWSLLMLWQEMSVWILFIPMGKAVLGARGI